MDNEQEMNEDNSEGAPPMPVVSPVPTDRLTELCEEMLEPLGYQENHDVYGIVLLKDADDGAIVTHGYEDQTDALRDLILHLQQMFRAMGKDIEFVGVLDEDPKDES